MSDFDFDPQAVDTIGDMSAGGFVQLPFDHLFAYWIRGDAAVQPDLGSGARHYGGWAVERPAFEAVVPAPVPDKFILEHVTNASGEAREVYAFRNIICAPFARRFRWYVDSRRQDDKGRGHVQYAVLTALFNKTENKFNYFKPAILSCKGLTSVQLDKCFSNWKAATATLRANSANNAPPNFFWLPVGTFGAERKAQKAGQSYITPPSFFVPSSEYGKELDPNKLTVDDLRRLYIGRELTDKMAMLRLESQEWLDEWSKPQDAQPQRQASSKPIQPEDIPF